MNIQAKLREAEEEEGEREKEPETSACSMKRVIALVVILQLCHSFNTSLNAEMIRELSNLKQNISLIKDSNKVSIMCRYHFTQNTC